jgi:hypothetical protein
LSTVSPPPADPTTELVDGDREARAAFVLCLDAINFGSGWWPTIRKRPGHSGYFTIAAGLTERFRESGPWSAGELTELRAGEIAGVVGQDAAHPLMADYAAALNDVGERVGADHGGRFEAVVEAAQGSAPALAGLLAEWRAFADVSTYDDRPVPFFKRAQIAAADIDRMGVAELHDLDRLTAFADNPRPPRPPHRRRAAPGPHAGGEDRSRRAARARLPRRSSCVPAPSTRSSCSPSTPRLPPPISTGSSGTAAAASATSRFPDPGPATRPTSPPLRPASGRRGPRTRRAPAV